jgi:glycosyltransferase involved in cell wall biosynthesis
LAEQVWLPLAIQRAGVQALLCPTASVPLLLSRPAVVSIQRLLSSHPEFWATGEGSLPRWRGRLQDHWYRAGIRRSVRRAAAILAVSDQARREAIRGGGVDPTRVVVARHGVSDRFRPVDAPQRIARLLEQHGLRVPFFVVVEALSPYKNLDRVIEGLAQVRQWSHQLPMLALIGSDRFGCWPDLARLADTLDLQDQVRFLGALPPSDLPPLYTAATASLSLSPSESWGLPMVESMACGCPVVCARRSSLPEVAGDAALFVDPDRPQEVAEAIWRLATLPNIRDAWVERGIEHARQFDWHETARITRDTLIAAATGRAIAPRDTRLEVGNVRAGV